MSRIFTRAALKRIVLSAGKAFIAAVVAYVIAHQSDILSGGTSAVKTVAVAAIVAGLDAAFEAVQVAVGA